MGIEEKVLLARKTKDEKLIMEIIEHYEPLFCENICIRYGNKYEQEAKKMLPNLVYSYIYNENIKIKLSDSLRKKVLNFFPKKYYDKIIKSDNKEYVKQHYINKLYDSIVSKNINILTNEEIMNLSIYIISNFYNNYLNGDKKSTVSNYFNSQINRKLVEFKDNENLILYYANKIEINNKIVSYFINKYEYLLNKYHINDEYYESLVKNYLTCKKKISFETFLINNSKEVLLKRKRQIKEYIDELKKGNLENYNDVKDYYSYIIGSVYESYKDKVALKQNDFKKLLEKKYNEYFKEVIICMIKNDNIFISRSINNRLNFYVKNTKKLYKKIYVDDNLKEAYIKDNEFLINKYAHKYFGKLPFEKVIMLAQNEYYTLAEEYYTKNRKASFDSYVKNGLRNFINKIDIRYIDDSIKEDFTKK